MNVTSKVKNKVKNKIRNKIMSKITFYKYHGLGNDFVLINDFKCAMPKNKKFITRLCDRHFGVGADGIIYVQKALNGNYQMQIKNSDGSEAMMCGNGIRCLAKHLFDFGYVKSRHFNIETRAGTKLLRVKTGKNNKVKSVVVGMGRPQFFEDTTSFGERIMRVSVGNPHAVIFKQKIDMNEVKEKGPKIENDKQFRNKTNVEFVCIKNKREIKLVVYERGAGLTLASGTGACASVAAAAKKGLVKFGIPISVILPGGKLKITIKKDYSSIDMEGGAEFVFSGVLKDPKI